MNIFAYKIVAKVEKIPLWGNVLSSESSLSLSPASSPPRPASSLFISFKGERAKELSSKNGLAVLRGTPEGEGPRQEAVLVQGRGTRGHLRSSVMRTVVEGGPWWLLLGVKTALPEA